MKTIEQIALELAQNIPVTGSPFVGNYYVSPDFVKQFAKAFLAAVDAERGEPVGVFANVNRDNGKPPLWEQMPPEAYELEGMK